MKFPKVNDSITKSNGRDVGENCNSYVMINYVIEKGRYICCFNAEEVYGGTILLV